FGEQASPAGDREANAGIELNRGARFDGECDAAVDCDVTADQDGVVGGAPGCVRDNDATVAVRIVCDQRQAGDLDEVAAVAEGLVQSNNGEHMCADGQTGADCAQVVDHRRLTRAVT